MSAIVTRLPNPERSLAGFEIAFGIAALIHGPIIQMLSAGTAIVRGRRSYKALLRLLRQLVLVLTSIHLLLAIPPVFGFLVATVLGIPEELVPVANTVFAILVPLTGVVGYRRFYQGALIQAGRTRVVSMTMVVRLSATFATLALGLIISRLGVRWAPPGHVVAALSFLAGLIAGLVTARTHFIRELLPQLAAEEEEEWTPRRLMQFYLPLALTSFIIMISRPLLAFAMARSASPVGSLAAWPLVQNYLFIFTAVGLSYQEVVIARRRSNGPKENPELISLAGIIAGSLLAIYLLAWLTGGTAFWYRSIMSAPVALLPLIQSTTAVLIPVPLLVVVMSSLNGVLVSRRTTAFITLSTTANVTVQLILALLLPTHTQLSGTQIASVITVSAMSIQLLVLALGIKFSGGRPE